MNQPDTTSGLPPVLLYEMGGVGTALIKGALQSSGDVSVRYANVLNHLHARELNAARRCAHWQSGMLRPQKIHEECVELQAVRGLKIVTIVDDPIAANLNGFFSNLPLIYGKPHMQQEMSLETLGKAFIEKCQHLYPLLWFNKEMQQVFGIDVYGSDFPCGKKMVRIRQGNCDLLVLRNDLGLAEKSAMLSEFLGVVTLGIHPTAPPHETKGIDARKEFLENVSMPREYVSRMLGSRYMRHFYSKLDLERLHQKWANQPREIAL